MCCLYTLTLSLNLVLYTPCFSNIFFQTTWANQDIDDVKAIPRHWSFYCKYFVYILNVYSFDSNNDSQHPHCKSWHFVTPTSSLLNSALASSFLSLRVCRLLLISLMLSNPWTLFLLRTSTEFLIALYTGGLFELNVEIYGKTSSACFSFGFLSSFWGVYRAFLIPFVIILTQ